MFARMISAALRLVETVAAMLVTVVAVVVMLASGAFDLGRAITSPRRLPRD